MGIKYVETYPNSMVLHEMKVRPPGVLQVDEKGRPVLPSDGYYKPMQARAKSAQRFLKHCEEAREKLVQIMNSKHATPAEQMRAAIEILDRAMGKPIPIDQMKDMEKELEGTTLNPDMLRGLAPEELRGALRVIAILKGTAEPDPVNPQQIASDSSGASSDSSGAPPVEEDEAAVVEVLEMTRKAVGRGSGPGGSGRPNSSGTSSDSSGGGLDDFLTG